MITEDELKIAENDTTPTLCVLEKNNLSYDSNLNDFILNWSIHCHDLDFNILGISTDHTHPSWSQKFQLWMDLTDNLIACGLSPFAIVTFEVIRIVLKHRNLEGSNSIAMVLWQSKIHDAIYMHYNTPWFYSSIFYYDDKLSHILNAWIDSSVKINTENDIA